MFNTSLIKQYIKKLKFHVNSLLLPLLDLFYLQSFLYKNLMKTLTFLPLRIYKYKNKNKRELNKILKIRKNHSTKYIK